MGYNVIGNGTDIKKKVTHFAAPAEVWQRILIWIRGNRC